MKKLFAKEEAKPIMIIAEQSNPIAVINTHNFIANDPKISPRYLVVKEHAVTHFEDMLTMSGDDNQQV